MLPEEQLDKHTTVVTCVTLLNGVSRDTLLLAALRCDPGKKAPVVQETTIATGESPSYQLPYSITEWIPAQTSGKEQFLISS